MKVEKILSVKFITYILILLIMGIFLFQTDTYIPSIRRGLSLYVINVLPATFPFFFFSKLLTELNFAHALMPLTEKPIKRLFHSKPIAGYIMVMSLLCGYPIGAKLLSEFYCAGFIDQSEAKKIATFTSTGGPIFIIGTIGVAMLGNKYYGYALLTSHYIGTVLNGLIFRGKGQKIAQTLPPEILNDDILNKSMTESFISVGVVGGFIVLFNLLIDIFNNLGIVSYIGFLLAHIKIPSRLSEGFINGLIEMTYGCKSLSAIPFPPYILLPCCSFLVTFGGLCITLQSLTYLAKIKISPGYYLLTKITQGILSSIIAFVLSLLFF